MRFLEVLNLKPREIIALVGAGGKSSTMYAIAKEAEQKGLSTIITTTTKIFYPEDADVKVIVSDNSKVLFDEIENALANNKIIVVGTGIELTKDINFPVKLLGLDENLFEVLVNSKADLIIVEADGAARKPFKAPAFHEPVIPKSATVMMPIVGIDCIDNVLSDKFVHRPEVIAQLAGVNIGDKITTEVVAAVLTNPLGYRKGVPLKAKWIPFINKVETFKDMALARQIAKSIVYKIPSRVLIGAAISEDPVKEVIEF